jgi:hypothetical protein
MSSPQQSKTKPFSIRFTEGEKATLRARAGEVPLSAFIRSAALGKAAARRASQRTPVRDADSLGQVLALLGQSRLANNLNQLAKAANLGSLFVTDEIEKQLLGACADIAAMRTALLAALGKQPAKPKLAKIFEQAANHTGRGR